MNDPHLCFLSLMPGSREFEVGSLWRCPDCNTLWRLQRRNSRRTWCRAGWWTRLGNRNVHARLYPASTPNVRRRR